MDAATLAEHHRGERGGDFQPTELSLLTPDERMLYQELLRTNYRLEQEKLPLAYVAASVGLLDKGHPLPTK